MKNKKIPALLAAAVLLCALLAACGDNNTGEKPVPVASGTDITTPAAGTPAGEPASETPASEAPAETPAETPAGDMTGEAAIDIALKDAGLSRDAVQTGTPTMEHSGAASFYRLQFWTEETIYEYDVDSATGEILSKTDVPMDTAAPATETDLG